MKKKFKLIVIFGFLSCLFTGNNFASELNNGSYRVLVFTKTIEYRHKSIPAGVELIKKLGSENSFQVTATDDSSVFTDDSLKNYATVVFLSTSGNVLNTEQEKSFQKYINNGGGYVGIHMASATEYDWDWYGNLVGTFFSDHPKIQHGIINVKNCCHTTTIGLPEKWEWKDEWYNYKTKLSENITVIATVDESTYEGGTYGDNHPVMWCHEYDGGKSWYTSLGHTIDSFSDTNFAKIILSGILYTSNGKRGKNIITATDLIEIDSARIINDANRYLLLEPIPLTDFSCDRSLGTVNDFYSEGDYWWPDSTNLDGPYIRRDGMSNPENFKAHRKAMRDMSIQVASLTAAFKVTKDNQYAEHAIRHLHKWFINKETRMNPNMNYAQAIKGICAGRGVGLIDGIHLVEVARSLSVLEENSGIDKNDVKIIKEWFAEFLDWMTTHEYGIDERERKNNHGSCWVMQAAEYARLTQNVEMTNYCIDRYKTVLLQNQMAEDGSFPMELERTKPYGYSLFNIDILASVCKILSSDDVNLWEYKSANNVSMKDGMEFIYPYIFDKSKWPFTQDIMYWDEWPVRHPSLFFAGNAFKNKNYLELWKKLLPEPKSQEGLRNFPIRQPILWID